MTVVTLRASGSTDPDEVWDRYARPARWSTWSPQIQRVDTSDDRLRAGSTGRVFGPLGVSVDFVVERWDDASRRWTWTTRRGPLRLRMTHGVDARTAGSQTWLRIRGPLPVVVGYAPLAQYALWRLVH